MDLKGDHAATSFTGTLDKNTGDVYSRVLSLFLVQSDSDSIFSFDHEAREGGSNGTFNNGIIVSITSN